MVDPIREAKYYSQYSGESIDEAIAYIKKLMQNSPDHIVDSTVDAKLDLNTLVDDGNYYVQHFKNSYDDTLSGKQIKVTVINFDNHIRQNYVCEGENVERVYDRTSSTWSAWKKESPYIISKKGQNQHPTKPTIIFQEA